MTTDPELLKALARNTDRLNYAGFGPRLGSLLLDGLILLPLNLLVVWADGLYRLFTLYHLVPGILFGLFYEVYLVRRFGGTPGKLIMGIRIRKVGGEPVGYREAFLRYLPTAVLTVLVTIALIVPLFRLTDAEYQSLTFMDRAKRLTELAPSWYQPMMWLQNAWVWGELLVVLTNRKRRALHDFIAGTVVVHASSTVPPPADAEASVAA